jgi:hypothetical protein
MDKTTADAAGETKLRGDALNGAERKRSPGHVDYDKTRNPDTVLRTDGEEDTLYNDGLDIEDDTPPFVDTPGVDSTR